MSNKKILVAVDGSSQSEKIIEKTIEYLAQTEAKVILVHCHRKFSTVLGQPYRDKEIPQIKQHSQKLIDPYVERLRENKISTDAMLMEEPAGAAIVDIATIEQCDLIIMGSRGLTNLAGLIVGSVTNRVLQTAPCSVLVVR